MKTAKEELKRQRIEVKAGAEPPYYNHITYICIFNYKTKLCTPYSIIHYLTSACSPDFSPLLSTPNITCTSFSAQLHNHCLVGGNRNVLLVSISGAHPQRVLVSGPFIAIGGVNLKGSLKSISYLKPLVMQLRAQHHVLRVIVKRTRPWLLTYREVRGGHLGHVLQTTILASLVAIQASSSLRCIWIIHHAVVHTAIQLESITGMHTVVVVRQDPLNRLSPPEVPDPGPAPPPGPEVSLDDDGLELSESLQRGSDH
jgi:hypothetical protein